MFSRVPKHSKIDSCVAYSEFTSIAKLGQIAVERSPVGTKVSRSWQAAMPKTCQTLETITVLKIGVSKADGRVAESRHSLSQHHLRMQAERQELSL